MSSNRPKTGRFFITILITLLSCAAIQLGGRHFLKSTRRLSSTASTAGSPSTVVTVPVTKTATATETAATAETDLNSPVAELRTLGAKVLDEFPRNSDFAKLSSEEVHMMPKELFAASLQLKLYSDRLQNKMKQTSNHPSEQQKVAEEGAHFYESCASESQIPSSLRAVCFIHFIDYSVKSGHPQDIPKLHMPLDVIQIAKAITPSRS